MTGARRQRKPSEAPNLDKKPNFKTATGRRVRLTYLLGQEEQSRSNHIEWKYGFDSIPSDSYIILKLRHKRYVCVTHIKPYL